MFDVKRRELITLYHKREPRCRPRTRGSLVAHSPTQFPPRVILLKRATCIGNPEQAKTVPCAASNWDTVKIKLGQIARN